jgi:hypothetical protein
MFLSLRFSVIQHSVLVIVIKYVTVKLRVFKIFLSLCSNSLLAKETLNKTYTVLNFHVRWVPFHHGMVRPQVADGEDVLQIWRAAANIFNKQSWRADKRWFSRFWVWRVAKNSSP